MENLSERKRIGSRIADIRKTQGISQAKLAELTGIAPGNIARIETGRYSTGIDIISKIADAMTHKLEFVEK